MNAERVSVIRRSLEERTTEDLARIYRQHDDVEWSQDAFRAIEQILLQRGEPIPAVHSSEPAGEQAFSDRPETAAVVPRPVEDGRWRRTFAIVIALAAVATHLIPPGAGHLLLNRTPRGVTWFIAAKVLRLSSLYSGVGVVAEFLIRLAAVVDVILVAMPPSRLPRWRRVALYSVVLVSVNLAVVSALTEFGVETFVNSSGSMMPALVPGDLIVVNKAVYRFREPRRGDVVIYPHPHDERLFSIHRIVAVPGEEIVIRGREVYVGGHRLNEPTLVQIGF